MIKRIVTIFAACFLAAVSVCSAAAQNNVQQPVINSAAACALLCVNNGDFIYEKSPNKQLPMASTTKILTALIALEQSSAKNTYVTFTKEMFAEGSSMYLKEGNKLSLKDLAVGMMTVSGNDAANAAAVSIGGSADKFAVIMNQKAQQIGMNNSHFVTPSGLDNTSHYSTAHDMAVLMAYAMQNEDFAAITAQKSIKVNFAQPKDTQITYTNHNRLLSLYKYCTGGKTGFTKTAGRCLVTCAKKDGVQLVAVTLNDGDDWNDHIKLYDYGFDTLVCADQSKTKFSAQINIVGGKQSSINVSSLPACDIAVPKGEQDSLQQLVQLPPFLYAPIEKGQTVGTVLYMLNGKQIGFSDITANDQCAYQKVSRNFLENIWNGICEFFSF